MRRVRMAVGPYAGQEVEMFDHEADAALATGVAEEVAAVEPAPEAAPAKKLPKKAGA